MTTTPRGTIPTKGETTTKTTTKATTKKWWPTFDIKAPDFPNFPPIPDQQGGSGGGPVPSWSLDALMKSPEWEKIPEWAREQLKAFSTQSPTTTMSTSSTPRTLPTRVTGGVVKSNEPIPSWVLESMMKSLDVQKLPQWVRDQMKTLPTLPPTTTTTTVKPPSTKGVVIINKLIPAEFRDSIIKSPEFANLPEWIRKQI